MSNQAANPDFDALLDYLKNSRGFDFTGYKPASLIRRINKRMNTVNITGYSDYIDYLEVHPEEFTHLFNTILINVTGFFRDQAAWDYLRDDVLPVILSQKVPAEPIRVWSTGCASGEEVYSIAMLLAEALGEEEYRERVKIYATDVDEEALNKARMGMYSEKEVEEIPEDLLGKYFSLTGGTYTFKKELRRNLIFGRNDLIQDAPISHIDLLVCRNTLMYFNAETQRKIITRFHFALNDSGFLFLGKAEMLLSHTNLFTPVNSKMRIFRKVPRVNLRDRLLNMAHNDNHESTNHVFNLVRLRDSAFETEPLAQVILDSNNALVMANELARRLFGLTNRDIGRPFQDLELSYHPIELRSVIQRAYAERIPVHVVDVKWPSSSNEHRYFDVRIQPLQDNGSSYLGTSITFIDVTQSKHLQRQLEQTNHELETAFEELQSTNEELETMNEELQSTIEELETTNEELQSTNEELETMNEELQSTNEELQTLNDEMQVRTEELNQVNAFLKSILSSLQSAVIVVDRDLRILAWNTKSAELWGLDADEVLGKNFLNLDIGLPVEALKRPFWSSLAGEADGQEVTLTARNRRGKKIQCQVTVMPLTAGDRTILGAIALITDDEIAESEKEERQQG